MTVLTGKLPTPCGTLWVGGDAQTITEMSWQSIAGKPHQGELDWFLDALQGYLNRTHHVFPGGLGFAGAHPVWLKHAEPVQAEGFGQRVYLAMCAIPYGRTMTYAELGGMLGNRYLARAVGNVCAANPVPIVVPCHRVVGAHSLGGYSGGLDKKRFLLHLEGGL